jgi:hypothetical protein
MPLLSTPKERQAYISNLRHPPEAMKISHFKSELIDSLPLSDNTKSPIDLLSIDLLRFVLDYLDPGVSVCFGLTNKKHYAVHWKVHGAVMPMERLSWKVYPEGPFGPFAICDVFPVSRGLYGFIAEFMLDGGWRWSKNQLKFVEEVDWEEIESQPRRGIWKGKALWRDCSD